MQPEEPTAIDIERPGQLEAYLRSSGRVAADEPLSVRMLAGGVSNRTMLVERACEPHWVVKQGLAKLRVEVDWFADPARVLREAAALRWLEPRLPPGVVPRFVFEDDRQQLLAMEAAPSPHDNWKSLLLAGSIDPGHVDQFAAILARLHRAGSEPRDPAPPGLCGKTLFESLRLEPYYGYAAQRQPAAAEFLRALMADARSQNDTLVHGDYSPKNILVHCGRLILLDYEVVHVGDAAFDVGFSLTHLLSKAHLLADQSQRFAQAARQYWNAYLHTLGDVSWRDGLERRAVRHALACLLARVDGRSPLEYFDRQRQSRQRRAVLSLIAAPPPTVPEVIDEFITRIAAS